MCRQCLDRCKRGIVRGDGRESEMSCRVSAVTSVSATVAVWHPAKPGVQRGTPSRSVATLRTLLEGEQEGTRHPLRPCWRSFSCRGLRIYSIRHQGYTTDRVPPSIRKRVIFGANTRVRKKIAVQWAPNACNAMRSSLTAVAGSSKFSAEMAHLACFVACLMDSSSSLNGPCDEAAGGGGAAG